MRRRPSSISLPVGLRHLHTAVLALAGVMLADSLFLLTVRISASLGLEAVAGLETAIPRFFQAAVLLHTGIGLTLAAIAAGFLVGHLRVVWTRRQSGSVTSGVLLGLCGLILAATGLFVLTDAASRDNRWIWWLHIVSAAVMLTAYLRHRFVSIARPARADLGRFLVAVIAAAAVFLVVHSLSARSVVRTPEALLAFEMGRSTGPGSMSWTTPSFDLSGSEPAGLVPPGSPFFPSPVTTTSGWYLPSRIVTRGETPPGVAEEARENGFFAGGQIGTATCSRCHQDIVEQWASSAHRFASMNNPFYEATIKLLRDSSLTGSQRVDSHILEFAEAADSVGAVKSKWCGGCHDPSILLAGDMANPISRESAEAQAGLTCLACHLIDEIHDRTGNGNYNLEDTYEDQYMFAGSADGTFGSFLHDAAMKAKPAAHKNRLLKPFFRDSEYCATCHKVSLSPPINNYRWIRGQNEFDAWHDSGISTNAARTFYLPPVKRVCQDCHMPPEPAPLGDVAAENGTVRSHRFLAANTALPFIRGDEETVGLVEEFLSSGKLRVDIFAVRFESSDAPVMALDRSQVELLAAEKVTFDVVVRNLGVGHTFPGGTNDSNEGWLEFTIRDEEGRVIAQSGSLLDDRTLDPAAHVYKSVMLDGEGNPILRRNTQDAHVTVFANVINPGTADLAHYEFVVPPSLRGNNLSVGVRLLWRKFNRGYSEFAFANNPEGFRAFDEVPDLPVTEIASDLLTVAVVDRLPDRRTAPDANAADWMRFNDYGIASLLEGNTRTATLAFERVAGLTPERLDGPLNLARVAIADGNVTTAYEYLQRSEEIAPGDARTAWVWGVVLQEDGRYEEAALAYRRVLEVFEEDRAAWRNLGRTLYLNRQYEAALDAFDEVLAIDPEDRISFYHKMLCQRALGRVDDAERLATAYEYYSIDEAAQALTQRYRLENPGVNLMTQRIRTHLLTLDVGR